MVLLNNSEEYRTYKQSVLFLLITAVHELFPSCTLRVHQSVGKSTYCELSGVKVTEKIIGQLILKMREYVEMDHAFETVTVSKKGAQEIFMRQGDEVKASRLSCVPRRTVTLCKTGNVYTTVYGDVLPSAKATSVFDITPFEDGFLLRYPNNDSDGKIPPLGASRKLISTLMEYQKWSRIAGVEDVFSLNRIIKDGRENEIINISESLHEKRLSQIADVIKQSEGRIKVVLISGPSSSGKTTFANRLAIHLRVNGIQPVTISLDDYFKDRGSEPRDEFGKPDYEAVEALDCKLLSKQLADITEGKLTQTPRFDFVEGKRMAQRRPIKLLDNQVLIIEGIHALNGRISEHVADEHKLRIYCTPLTVLAFDEYNPISPTDTRFLRRMTRDAQFRGCTAEATFNLWPSVRRGESRNVFPFEGEADEIFNSSVIYEFAVIKKKAEAYLKSMLKVQHDNEQAQRLIEFLSYFEKMGTTFVPRTSILREFIGGSAF